MNVSRGRLLPRFFLKTIFFYSGLVSPDLRTGIPSPIIIAYVSGFTSHHVSYGMGYECLGIAIW